MGDMKYMLLLLVILLVFESVESFGWGYPRYGYYGGYRPYGGYRSFGGYGPYGGGWSSPFGRGMFGRGFGAIGSIFGKKK
ncbi:hypothetical protein LOAG_13235 [Loa loa]|uniref:Neuropeptide-like protein 31 n=1 Tax=Loa loa TaxID=7209 RepID=A0A1I7VKK6_LOALO|nr:hypothetical protein LOAG_13235 [Loa loa]EFO15276.2 hypothetical protein LOAG_13235 [Loa loa]